MKKKRKKNPEQFSSSILQLKVSSKNMPRIAARFIFKWVLSRIVENEMNV